MSQTSTRSWKTRNLVAYWIFGLCNNYAYVVMNSAAQDILKKHSDNDHISSNGTMVEQCVVKMESRQCTAHSAGIVLFCNIFPSFIIKIIYPFIGHRIPYTMWHIFVCLGQAGSLLITSMADSVPIALCGVMLGSLASGLGETAYLGLASHYSKHTISTWASGTGMAGIAGSFSFAMLTEPKFLNLAPETAMLVMLVVPVIFLLTYFVILERPSTIREVDWKDPSTWIVIRKSSNSPSIKSKKSNSSDSLPQYTEKIEKSADYIEVPAKTVMDRWTIAKSLLKYMIPLFFVYFAEYLINQGLTELTVFDCSHGFGTTPTGQYRWYQVLYQVGVFVSRSSINLVQLSMTWIMILPVLQLINTAFLLFNAIYHVVPHFAIIATIVLYEGLIGGASYVNSFNHIHKKIDPSIREFALSTCSLADTMGIVAAALTAIPVHNAICQLPLRYIFNTH